VDDTPRVSILLPAYNAGPTLGSSLASITRQSEPRWECIVIDDGSRDDTAAIARDASRADRRIRVISTPHHGLVEALNTGLRHCRAPLVARMDADDVMHRERLSTQADALERDGALAAVGCHVRLFPRRSMSERLRGYEEWLNSLASADDVTRDAFVECPIAHPTLMMRRSMADLGYYQRGWPEDYDLVLRALASGMRIGVVPKRLLAWRDRPDRLSRTHPHYGLDRFTACKAQFLATGFLASSTTYVLWGYGGTGKALYQALAALGRTPSHIVEVKPTRVGQRIHGAPVIRPEALPALRGHHVVVSVARSGPRAEIRAALSAMDFIEGWHYVCAA
jgi:glycosyltransferase involved in cell wall biosynthesis